MDETNLRTRVAEEIARFFILHIQAEERKGPTRNQARIDDRPPAEINAEITRRLLDEFPALPGLPPAPFNLIEEWSQRNGFIFRYEEYSYDTYNRIFIERLISFKTNSEEDVRKFREIAQAVFGIVDYSQRGFSISFFIRVENNMRELLREIARDIPGIDHEMAWRLLFEQSKEYQEVVNEIFEKRLADALDQSDRLLHNILPAGIAAELKKTEKVEPVLIESATVLFTDFVGFTRVAENMAPRELIARLDECFSVFDRIIEKHRLEKIKTIGDAYMCAGGLPESNHTHPIDAALAALEMGREIAHLRREKEKTGAAFWDVRIGLHTGPLVAGVIARKKFSYDVWGDTVNTASRMESSGTPGKINLSLATYERIKPFFRCAFRGAIDTKSKGKLPMFYLEGLKAKFARDAAEGSFTPNSEFLEVYAKIRSGARLVIRRRT